MGTVKMTEIPFVTKYTVQNFLSPCSLLPEALTVTGEDPIRTNNKEHQRVFAFTWARKSFSDPKGKEATKEERTVVPERGEEERKIVSWAGLSDPSTQLEEA